LSDKPDLANKEEYIQLADSCNFLEHYHLHHSDDMITRFRGKGPNGTDIYVVSDPEWKEKLRACVAPVFPDDRNGSGKAKHRRRT
jgi:hypothetical protein